MRSLPLDKGKENECRDVALLRLYKGSGLISGDVYFRGDRTAISQLCGILLQHQILHTSAFMSQL
ncbi:hypothetical protein [Nostoc sp.]|uniref:hypothetical protein n=1 Tax=Nostoc sp. TaxID=1180 RepID=UPI002FFA64A3